MGAAAGSPCNFSAQPELLWAASRGDANRIYMPFLYELSIGNYLVVCLSAGKLICIIKEELCLCGG